MSRSSTSQHARLIRAFSPDPRDAPPLPLYHDGPDSPVNIDNTFSTDFDPENEAIASSNIHDGDTTQRLPALRDSAKKYKRFTRLSEPAVAIHTSSFRNAFPDFTQPGPSDSSVSIEIGRGIKNTDKKNIGKTEKSEDSIRPPTSNMTARTTRFGSNQGLTANTVTSNNSFTTPKLPKLSELVSGIFQDGTPVFSLQGKPRRCRCSGIDEIPLPQDEEAIIMSLNILQARVLELEKERAKSSTTIKELTSKNELLERERTESRRWRRSDSALGSTDGSDGGEDAVKVSRRWMIEKTRLENVVQKLREQVTSETRKFEVSEVAVKTLTKERDAAVTQLGVAFFTTEQLKTEKQSLSDRNIRLQAEIGQLKAEQEAQAKKWQRLEENLREKILRRDKMIQSFQEATQTTKKAIVAEEQSDSQLLASIEQPQLPSQAAKRDSTPHARFFSGQEKPIVVPTNDDTGDITYLSVNDDGEMAKLRRVLEQERIARKKKTIVTSDNQTTRGDALQKLFDVTAPLPSKHSVAAETIDKTDTGIYSEPSTPIRAPNTHQRHHSEDSLLQRRDQRSGLIDMTSAFIVPDITMRNVTANIDEFSQLPASPPKKTIKVPKPVPVSDRMPAALCGDEPTIRPSQPPAKALATVLKGLEDEMESLKRQHAHFQAIYNQHDPALSKRRRKVVYQKMQSMMKDIDIKADQIYSLYDVLEGQKAAGQTMTEDEFEMTLQSIGIDPNDVDWTGHDRSAHADGDGDDSEELPWEGIA